MNLQQEAFLNEGNGQSPHTGLYKNEFLVMLAHELRNPLTSISNALEIWKAGDAAKTEENEAQAIMGRQLQQIVQVVDDLLDMSGVTRGEIIHEEEPVDLLGAVTYAVEDSREGFAARKQEISLSLPKEKIFVKGDAVRLKQIVCNLLTNASKYTAPGGHIDVTLGCEAGKALIRVSDDGIGIAPELLPHLFDFDRFVQSRQSLDRQEGGLGLGLALVRYLVELHGGTVEVKSQGLNTGSAFTVRLPVMLSGVGVAPAADAPAAPQKASGAGLRVLVIEDDTDSAKTTQMLLELRGYEVLLASGGHSGLEAAQAFKPEVVLLDIGLPGMNGYEVARRLRALPEAKNTLLIALSGYNQTEDLRKSREAGFDHHMVKPPDTAELEALISGAARKHGPAA